MAKLSASVAAEVDEAESSSGEFVPVPAGKYVYKLIEVDDTGEGKAGPYWTWVLERVHAYHPKFKKGYGTRVYHVTSLSVPGMVKAMFEAFGYTADTETDEIVESGDYLVGRTVIDSYKKPGETEPTRKNVLKGVEKFDESKWEAVEDDADGDDPWAE